MSEEIDIIETISDERPTFEQFIENALIEDPKNTDVYQSLLELYLQVKEIEAWNNDVDVTVDKVLVQQILFLAEMNNVDVRLLIPTVSKPHAERFLRDVERSRSNESSTSGTKSFGREFLNVSYAGGDENYNLLFGNMTGNDKVGGAIEDIAKFKEIKFDLTGRMIKRTVGEHEITLILDDSQRAYSRDNATYILPRFAQSQILGVRLSLIRHVIPRTRTCISYALIDSYVDIYKLWLKKLFDIGIIYDEYHLLQQQPKSLISVGDDNIYNSFFEDFESYDDKVKSLQKCVNIIKSVELLRKLRLMISSINIDRNVKQSKYKRPQLEQIELTNQDLLNEMAKLNNIKLEYNYLPLAALFNNEQYSIYLRSLSRGIEDKQIQSFLRNLEMTNIINDINRRKKLETVKQSNLKRFIDQVRFEKYGYNKLTKKQQIEVEKEAQNRLAFYEMMAKNKCEHIDIMNKLRRSKSLRDREIHFDKLSKLVTKITTNSFVKCKKCGFDIICPHEFLMMRNKIKNIHDDAKIIQDYSARTKLNDIVCRVCSGVLKRVIIVDVDVNDKFYGKLDEDDALIKSLYSDILSAKSLVEFEYPVDHKEYMNAALRVLHPLAKSEDAKLNRNAVLTAEQIRDCRSIYITALAYSYVLLSFVKGFAKPVFTKEMNQYLAAAQVTVTNVHLGEKCLRLIYTIVSKLRVTNFARTINIPGYTLKELPKLIVDIYKLLVANNSVKKPTKSQREELKLNTLKNNTVFRYVSSVHNHEWKLAEWVKSFPLLKGDSLFVRSYNTFIKLITNENVDDELEQLRQIDGDKKLVQHILELPLIKTRQFERVQVRLSDIYNELGNRHKFDTFILTDGSEIVKKHDGYYRDGKKILLVGDRLDIADLKDSSTNIHKSETDKLDDERIDKIVKTKTVMNNFYDFFKNRCPEDGLHELKNNICKKCGMNIDKVEEKIYEKYKHKYDEFVEMETIEITQYEEIKIPVTKSDFEKTINNCDENVYKLSKIINVQPSQILLIGQYEKRELEQIKSGEYDPVEITSKHHPVLANIEEYILSTMRIYYIIKNFNKVKSSKKYENIVTIDKSSLSYLPDLEFFTNNKYAKILLTPSELHKYYLGTLCEIILFIHEIEHDILSSFPKSLAHFLISTILSNEEYKLKAKKVTFDIEDSSAGVDYDDENYNPRYESESDDDDETALSGIDDMDNDDNDDDNDIKVNGYGLD